MNRRSWLKTLLAAPLAGLARAQGPVPVPASAIRIQDEFWTPWLDRNRKISLPQLFRHVEEHTGGEAIYEAIQAGSGWLSIQKDAALEQQVDALVSKVAAGYQPRQDLYLSGHLFDAAAAHFRATGKRTLLEVALKDLSSLEQTLKPPAASDSPYVEQALIRLQEATGDDRCLKLARMLVDSPRAAGGSLHQQLEATGHAARAAYLYAAAADLARLNGDTAYAITLGRLWDDIVNHKMYLTGGIGSHAGKGTFGAAYELPNRAASAETCAAIAFAMWNQRMFLLDGDSKYIDLLERILYNGFLAATSLKGDEFFCENPLESDGRGAARQKQFDRPCCNAAATQFFSTIPSYIYSVRGADVCVNLFVSGEARVQTNHGLVKLTQETRYPWEGRLHLVVEPEQRVQFKIMVRLPGWALERPVAGDLYRYLNAHPAKRLEIRVNHRPMEYTIEKGYAVLSRSWAKGETIEMDLPIDIRRVLSHADLQDNTGKVALERGPLVYCVEGADNNSVLNLGLPDWGLLHTRHMKNLLGGVTVIEGEGLNVSTGMVQRFAAIPYYAWANRGANPMAVWMGRRAKTGSKEVG